MTGLIITVLLLAAVLVFVNKLPGGCSGNCRQGRLECDCKGDQK